MFALACASQGADNPSDSDTTSEATSDATSDATPLPTGGSDSTVGDPGSGDTSGAAESDSTGVDTASGGSESGSTGEPVDGEPWTGEHVNSKPETPKLAPFAISVGGLAMEYLAALKTDRHGNTYLAINSQSPTLVVDGQMFPNFTSNAYFDVALVKLAPDGTVEWVRLGDNPADTYLSGISIDANDDIVIIGQSQSVLASVTFDGQTVDVSSSLGFVAKLSPEGDTQWLTQSPVFEPQDVETAASGEIYVTGAALEAASLAMMSPDGAPMWRKDFSTSGGRAVGTRLEVGKEGLYWTGEHNADTITIGDTTLHGLFEANLGTFTDGIVALFDRDGETIWARAIGAEREDRLLTLETAASGGCLVSGDYEGALLEPANGLIEYYDYYHGYLAKFDADGDMVWAVNPTDAPEAGLAPLIAEDLAGNYHVPFGFEGDLEAFGQAFSRDLLTTLGIVKVTPDGEPIWSVQSASPMFNGHHIPLEIVVSRGGQQTVGGTFSSSAFQLGAWDLAQLPSGFKVYDNDVWVARMPIAP